jgi:hypothetical protein
VFVGRSFRRLLLLSSLAATQAGAVPLSAAKCEGMVREQPRELASYRCYWDLAHAGLCLDERGEGYSGELYRCSIAGFQRTGDAEGEGYARLSLFGLECMEARRCEENRDQLDRTDVLAAEHGLADLGAIAIIWRARPASGSVVKGW